MLLTSRRLVAASASLGLLVTTCTCAPPAIPEDVGNDAGRGRLDSGTRDAARRDAPRDVGRDAPHDAPSDGGPNDPEWVALEGQPDGVELYVARRPTRVLHVDWEDCGSGCLRASCGGCSFIRGFVDGSRRYARVQVAGPEQTATILDVESGSPVAAWMLLDNEEPIGRLGAPTVGGERIAISGKAYPPTGSDVISLWVTSIADTASRRDPVRQFETSASIINLNMVSATHHAWTLSPTNALFLRDETGVTVGFPGSEAGMIQNPCLVQDRVFYELWAEHIRVWTGTVDEPASVLIDAQPGDVGYFRTDGVTMTWLQGYDFDRATSSYARLELWTAPYTTRGDDLAPRRVVASFRGLVPMALGGHWVALQGEGRSMDVLDLLDGTRRSWTPPEGGNVGDPPLYATDTEILVATTVGTFRINPNALPVVAP